jgi:bifunctional DNase/RNase
MHEVELTIKGLSYSQGKSGAYALILAEKGGAGRKLPVVIGGSEAQSIAVAMEKSVAPPRPLSHDTWFNMLNALEVRLEKVVIHRLVNGVFFASLYALDGNGVSHTFDSRPSDACAMAVRANCPIYALESILQQAGISEKEEAKADGLPDPSEKAEATEKVTEPEYTLEELQVLLEEAVENEDYERAANLRDKIDRLK